MVQLNRARFSPGPVHRNKVSDTHLHIEDHLAVLAIFAAVIVTAHLLECIPSASCAHLVNGEHGVEITILRGQLGRAFFRGCEGCPCGGTTSIAGMVWLARILGSTGCGVNCRTAEREFARLFLNIPQLGD